MGKDSQDLNAALEILGNNISTRLKELKMTRKQLAEIVGVSQNSVSSYCRAKQLPTFDKLFAIANALQTTISDLTGGDACTTQVQNLIRAAEKKAVQNYQIADAQQTLNFAGFLCRKENGTWFLARQRSVDDVLNLMIDGTKPKIIRLPDGDESLVSLAETVKNAALQNFNSSKIFDEANKKLDCIGD